MMRNKFKRRAAMGWLMLALALGVTGMARAQDTATEIERETDERNREQAEAAREAEQAALEARLDAAQSRMEIAAREIAMLSAQLVGEATSLALRSLFDAAPRPMLGVNIDDSNHQGVPVLAVTPGGPADEAGLRAGDVLTRIDDVPLGNGPDTSGSSKLSRKMKSVSAGQAVTVHYLRQGEEQQVTVTPRELDPGEIFLALEEAGDLDFDLEDLEDLEELRHLGSLSGLEAMGHGPVKFFFGGAGRWSDMELVTLSPDLGSYFGSDEGILVVKAPADPSLELKDGDVILDIGGRTPTSPEHAMRILRSYEAGESLRLGVIREKRRVNLDIQVPATSETEDDVPGVAEPARFERKIIIGPPEEA